jgi:flavin-dependent dehydrogenase
VPDVPNFDADVIVVGGGPAGSVSAWLLAERGHRVLLLDKARFPRHKACSEYVNPAGARLLAELGLAGDLEALGAHRMEAMLIHAPGGHRFLADFGVAEPGSTAIGLARLDLLLLNRARDAGVEVCEGAHVRDILVADGSVQGVKGTIDGARVILRAPLTIGADGRHGVVSRALGLDMPLWWPRRTGLVAHYRGVTGLGSWGEMHVAPAGQGYAGLAPLEEGLTNVAFVTASAAVANRPGSLEAFFAEGLASIPAIASRLAGAERVGGIRGIGPMAHRARKVIGDGFMLVGDAASFLDPFTGDGIHEALRGATLLAPVADGALRAGDLSVRRLASYRAARHRAFWAKRQVCWLVQGFIATPALMDYATMRLDRRAAIAQILTGVLGDLSPARQGLSPVFLARLLWP